MRYDETIKNFGELPDEAVVPVQVASVIRGESIATTWRRAHDGLLTPIRTGPNTTRFRVGQIRQSLKGTHS